MTTKGPEDRERFAQRSETGVPRPGALRAPEQEKSAKVVVGGSLAEALCGAAAVILAIVALAGTAPRDLASVATIAFGVALVAHGGAIAARFRELTRQTSAYEWDTRTELGGGMGAELIGGATGIVLGVLGLIGIAPAVLLPIAVIVFGGALLLGSGATIDLGTFGAPGTQERFAHLARQATTAASGTQALVGVAAVVLGILALVGFDPIVLPLVALLVLGAAAILSGAAVSSRMAAVMRR